MSTPFYIVASTKPWNRLVFERRQPQLQGHWELVQSPEQLVSRTESGNAPRYIFFPHWSWKVPERLLNATECVCFHMTDLPFGRGGSPLQNLIERGFESTMLTALRMTEALDAGPIYCKRPLSLEGRAQEIYERAAMLAFDMIETIARTEPEPTPQSGEGEHFVRRRPDQSVLPDEGDLRRVYDHIRMLDAETYPPAFVDHGSFRLEFTNAQMGKNEVRAEVIVRRRTE